MYQHRFNKCFNFILIYKIYRGLILYIFKTVVNLFLIDLYDLYNLHTKVY